MKTAQDIADQIAAIAAATVDCPDLDSRDKNTLIGQLRNAAAFARGAVGLPGFKQAAFQPTVSGGPKPGA